jgi:putative acetyltransferase
MPGSDAPVRIVGWDAKYATDFDRLNREWLERYFTVEPLDAYYLSAPFETIIAKGGEIFFALDGEVAVGCCAALPRGDGAFELAKLGVTSAAQGRGVGKRLCEAVVAYAHARGAERVLLVTNHTLIPAIRIYESLGFVHAPFPFPQPYAESDVYMERVIRTSP